MHIETSYNFNEFIHYNKSIFNKHQLHFPNVIKKTLNAWKLFLEKEKGIDFSNLNVNVFSLAMEDLSDYEYQNENELLAFLIHWNPNNEQMIKLLEDYTQLFTKETQSSFEVAFFEFLFNNPLLEEELLFGSYVNNSCYHWGFGKVVAIVNKNKTYYFSITPDFELGGNKITELALGTIKEEYPEMMAFYPKNPKHSLI